MFETNLPYSLKAAIASFNAKCSLDELYTLLQIAKENEKITLFSNLKNLRNLKT